MKTNCHFCGKKLGIKKYYINTFKDKLLVCSECEYLCGVLSKQVSYGRVEVIRKIIQCIRYESRDCTLCKFFNEHRREYCKRGLNTYIGKNRTYAGHGCNSYFEVK